ncbi:hypothetical protein Srubr_22610 [Streptomyces rubradiris]|uniref:Uncharacterized protein n=1 Tax=Streptomyces rubradiris TaxID=285531 RepID=A0ABQ3R993_STRRR|nr:hypothetical protein GCM10018792_13160 [Streptomyces rubradiris]GHI52415.1 hypothetical protein Srubr_22610 [Streptomyces rubradiris]
MTMKTATDSTTSTAPGRQRLDRGTAGAAAGEGGPVRGRDMASSRRGEGRGYGSVARAEWFRAGGSGFGVFEWGGADRADTGAVERPGRFGPTDRAGRIRAVGRVRGSRSVDRVGRNRSADSLGAEPRYPVESPGGMAVTAVPFPPGAVGGLRTLSGEFRARTGLMGASPGEKDCDHLAKGTRSAPERRPMTAKITDRGEARTRAGIMRMIGQPAAMSGVLIESDRTKRRTGQTRSR